MEYCRGGASMDQTVVLALLFATRLTVCEVLLVAGISKLQQIALFSRLVGEYRIVPIRYAHLSAWTVVGGELLTSVALLVPQSAAFAMLAAAALFSTFAVAICVNLIRGRSNPCGCFGSSTEPISAVTLTRVALLLTIVILSLSLDHFSGEELSWPGGPTLFLTIVLNGFFLVVGTMLLAIPTMATVLFHDLGKENEA